MENNKSTNYKNIFLIIISVITVIAVIYGTCTHVFGLFGYGKKPFTANWGKNVSGTIALDGKFENVNIDVDIADIEIVYGDAYKLDYDIPEMLIPTVSYDGGTLYIKSKGTGKGKIGNVSAKNYKINIVLPKEVGNVDIAADCGNVEISDLSCKNFNANLNLGNLEIERVSSYNFEVSLDCGNLETENCEMKEVTAECNLGNVEFENVKFDKGNFDVDMGDIEIDGDFKEISGECSMGSIDIKTVRPESEVNINLDVDMGDIRVNGKKWK